MGVKADGKEFAVVEVDPGENAEGLLYIHPVEALEVIGTRLSLLPRTITLPFEISVPYTVRTGKKSTKSTSVTRKAREEYFPLKMKSYLYEGPVSAEVIFHGSQDGDIDNRCKPVLDLLKGSVLVDDIQVKSLTASFSEDGEDGFTVKVTAYEKRGKGA